MLAGFHHCPEQSQGKSRASFHQCGHESTVGIGDSGEHEGTAGKEEEEGGRERLRDAGTDVISSGAVDVENSSMMPPQWRLALDAF